MKKCRITVMRVARYPDLMARYHIVKDIGIIQSILPIKR